MSNETPDLEWDQEEKPERHRSRSRERKQSLEEQVLNVAKDDIQKARELVMIRKELLRLHYKVKNYHNQARLANGIIQLVIVALLLVVLYRLYTI
jgi:hypothetical protein